MNVGLWQKYMYKHTKSKKLVKVSERNDLLLVTLGICGMKGVVMDLMTVYFVVCQSASVHVCSKNKSML